MITGGDFMGSVFEQVYNKRAALRDIAKTFNEHYAIEKEMYLIKEKNDALSNEIKEVYKRIRQLGAALFAKLRQSTLDEENHLFIIEGYGVVHVNLENNELQIILGDAVSIADTESDIIETDFVSDENYDITLNYPTA